MIIAIVTVLFMIPVVVMSYWIGKAKGRFQERTKVPASITPTCPCGHVWGSHKNGGQCQAQVRRQHYDSLGWRSGFKYVNCSCTKYHGPELVTSEFFHPGVITQ